MFNRPGICGVTGQRIFEITHWDGDRPVRIGPPDPAAVRVGFALADGSVWPVSLHRDALARLPDELPSLWQRALLAWRWEIDNLHQGDKPEHHQVRLDWLARMIDNVPLGVLYVEPWTEVLANSVIMPGGRLG